MADKEEYQRSERRKKAYAAIAEAELRDASYSKDSQQLSLKAAIEFLSHEGLLFASLMGFPGEDAQAEDVRNRAVDAVARLAVERLQERAVAGAEFVRAMATPPLPLQPIARHYLVGVAGMKAEDKLPPEYQAQANQCYNNVIDAIAAMEESKRDSAIDDVTTLRDPLSYVATWLERYVRS